MDLTLRPMTQAERAYCYTPSHQIIMQTGLIGHLRGDFGSSGEEFHTTWDDHKKDIKSEDFVAEFDEVINALRTDKRFGGILKSSGKMRAFCSKYPESSIEQGYNYGFRADTAHYSYMLRVTPKKGEYNLYCYCYLRQWLEGHMKRAEKGIRIITPNYRELFRVADGDPIRIITKGGEKREMTCRYIDEYHLETFSERGQNLYHICEFAEQFQTNACQSIIPLRRSLPDRCYGYLEATGEMILITKGESGYTPTGDHGKNMTPQEAADQLNDAMGVTKAQGRAMMAGYLSGWADPKADPKFYDEDGHPIRHKNQNRGEDR